MQASVFRQTVLLLPHEKQCSHFPLIPAECLSRFREQVVHNHQERRQFCDEISVVLASIYQKPSRIQRITKRQFFLFH